MPGFLEMSDEEFAKQAPPVVQEETKAPVTTPEGVVSVEAEVIPEKVEQPVETPLVESTPATPVVAEETPVVPAVETPPVVQQAASVAPEKKPEGAAPVVAQTPAAETAPAQEVDYKAFYERMTAPFKANGKMIQMQTPEEVEQLMKMGANYTQKMQALAPHRKVLMMLDNNGLLDESRLSFLIDLDKKNPEAIKKLIKDSGIDPMTIDNTVEPAYQAGSHGVSEAELTFRSELDELSSTEEGKKTVQLMNTEWDQASKEVLWQEPKVMTAIHQQRENGIYDRISAEVNRQKILGTISASTPFIHAYKLVGDQMQAAGAFADIAPTAPVTSSASGGMKPEPARQPLAVKAITPKPVVSNSSQAIAASSPRTTPKPAAGSPINPLAMSDEDFLKQMQNRL